MKTTRLYNYPFMGSPTLNRCNFHGRGSIAIVFLSMRIESHSALLLQCQGGLYSLYIQNNVCQPQQPQDMLSRGPQFPISILYYTEVSIL